MSLLNVPRIFKKSGTVRLQTWRQLFLKEKLITYSSQKKGQATPPRATWGSAWTSQEQKEQGKPGPWFLREGMGEAG